MIQNLIFGILFLKYIISGTLLMFLYLIFPFLCLSWRSSRCHYIFFNSRFSSRKSQSQQKLAKTIHTFSLKIKFRSKNPTHFTNFNSLDIENNMLPQHSQKPFWLYKFSCKHVSVWCQKKCLHCIISWRLRTVAFLKHFESKYLYISIYLL